MPERLKVLISAYACEPNKGSEPEVGWQLALHMAKFHDVTVLTRANNRKNIETALSAHAGPQPSFIYYDLPKWVLDLKPLIGIPFYYVLWQIGARRFMNGRLASFDLVHHATFNSFRNPGFWWFCPTPVLIGPLGGGQICPWRFLPWFRKQIVQEILRSLSVVNSFIFPHIYLSLYFADKILIANEDTGKCVPWLFHPKLQRMLETAVSPDQLVESPPPKDWPGVRLLWISRLDKLKGGELAIRAFAQAAAEFPGLTMTMVGKGREERPLKRLIKSLRLEKLVTCEGAVPKAEITNLIVRHNIFVFTSLRDTSGNVVLEAMAAGLPVITFAHHGAVEMTTEQTALRVPITTRRETVQNLGQAMVALARDPDARERLGRAGRERVREHYLWEGHAREMDTIYRQIVDEQNLKSVLKQRTFKIILVPKGILMAIAVLFLVGASEFLAINKLKKNADMIVKDTLPGLTYAGEANASLAQAFNRTLLLVSTESPEQRSEIHRQIESFSQQTTHFLDAYQAQIYSAEDRARFESLSKRRQEYLEIRDHVLATMETNRPQALSECKDELLPAYARYKEAGDKLFEYNMVQGRSRGQTIMRVCTITQLLVAGIGIILFVIGFLLGVSK